MDEKKLKRFLTLTNELKDLNDKAYKQFTDHTKEKEYEMDFYGEVKPFADHVTALAEEWRDLALDWLADKHPRYVHRPQVMDTYDNLTIVCVTAFQKDTRRRRFINTIKSIDYVLDTVLIANE